MSLRVVASPMLAKPPRMRRCRPGAIEPTSHGWNSTPFEPVGTAAAAASTASNESGATSRPSPSSA